MFCRRNLAVVLLWAMAAQQGWCASGTEGASFLDIPVGAGPAALGSAYTAQATDVYAPVWNPAGLGFLHGPEFTGMHLIYIDPVSYEHAGFVIPLGKKDEAFSSPAGIGVSVQYLGANSIDARDEAGNPQGSFNTAFAAYSLAYGRKLSKTCSIGATAKLITEKISDATARAFGADLGVLYKPISKLNLGAAIANVGSDIKFVSQSDPLPLAVRLGATYQLRPQWILSAEDTYRRTGLVSGALGVEWRFDEKLSIRAGYNTSRTKELGAAAGFSAGVGLFYWGQEFSYAWLPVGDLGQTHYFSLIFRSSLQARPERPSLKSSKNEDPGDTGDSGGEARPENSHDYQNIFDILNDDERKAIQ